MLHHHVPQPLLLGPIEQSSIAWPSLQSSVGAPFPPVALISVLLAVPSLRVRHGTPRLTDVVAHARVNHDVLGPSAIVDPTDQSLVWANPVVLDKAFLDVFSGFIVSMHRFLCFVPSCPDPHYQSPATAATILARVEEAVSFRARLQVPRHLDPDTGNLADSRDGTRCFPGYEQVSLSLIRSIRIRLTSLV